MVWDYTGRDSMGRDWMVWDEMGWDGMGLGGMGCDGRYMIEEKRREGCNRTGLVSWCGPLGGEILNFGFRALKMGLAAH